MYRAFFNLLENPFDNSPDPRFFFNSPEHEEAIASLQHVALHRKGAILLTGEPGVGKTLVGRLAMRNLNIETRTVWLKDSLLSTKEMIVEVCRGLHLDVDSEAAQVDLMATLERYLVNQFRNDIRIVLVVDELQDFSSDAIRLLKTLNNLEVDDAKLVQIVALGRKSPEDQAVVEMCRVFRERLYRVMNLAPLTADQTSTYINHRLKLAGENCKARFTDGATDLIFEVSDGIPRSINKICEFALLAAYAESVFEIDENLVARAIAENQLDTHRMLDRRNVVSTTIPVRPTGVTKPSQDDREDDDYDRAARRALRRADRLDQVVQRADATTERMQSARRSGQKQLTRLETVLDQVRRVTEHAEQTEQGLQAQREHLETEVQERVGTATARIEGLMRKLEARMQDYDRVHDRARRDTDESRETLLRIEQANQQTAGVASGLEELHGRARGAADIYRALQSKLDTAEHRVDHLLTASQQHLARLDQSEKAITQRLESAGNVTKALENISSVERQIKETLANAKRSHSDLTESHDSIQETLSASEDHYANLVKSLSSAQEFRDDTAGMLERIKQERTIADSSRKDAEVLLDTLTQRKAQLTGYLEQVSERSRALTGTNQQLESLLDAGKSALKELDQSGRQIIDSVTQSVDQADRRATRIHSMCETEVSDAEKQLAHARKKTSEEAELIVVRSEMRLTEARERASEVAENSSACLSELQERISETADESIAQIESRLAAADQRIEAKAETAEKRLNKLSTQTRNATDQAVTQADVRLNEIRRDLNEATSAAGTCLAGLGETIEGTLTEARQEMDTLVRQAVEKTDKHLVATRIQAEESLAVKAGQAEARVADAHELVAQAARTAEDRSALLENANRAAIQNAGTTRRLLQQLGQSHDQAIALQSQADRAQVRLAAETNRASDVIKWIGDRLGELDQARTRIESTLAQADQKIEQLQNAAHKGQDLSGKATDLLERMDAFRGELARDRARAAKVIRRSRRHLAASIEADARVQCASKQAEDRADRIYNGLYQADKMLAETGVRLESLSEANVRTEAIIRKSLEKIAAGEQWSDAMLETLEERQATVRGALDRLNRSTRTALRISKTQNRVGNDFQRQARRLISILHGEKEAAEDAAAILEQTVQKARNAVQQPRALIEEARQRVPQLQKLARLIHEIYFKLNLHVPEMITPDEWERSAETAEGATRRLVVANTARIRQLVDVSRRLFEKTAERLVHLQTENQRAATLCHMLPERIRRTVPRASETDTILGRLSGRAETLGEEVPASTTAGESPPGSHGGLRPPAALASRIAALANVVTEAADADQTRNEPDVPTQRTPQRAGMRTVTQT